jgi:YD repeat-containing protein
VLGSLVHLHADASDGLDRILTVDYPTDDGWVYSYDSETGSNQKGRLASVTNGTVTTHLSYTPRGEVLIESTTISGGTYLTGYSYDAAGNLKSIDDPNRVKTDYFYAGARPGKISVEGGGQTETIEGITWWPFGPRKHAEFPPFDSGTGNVVVSERHQNLRGQVDEVEVVGP